MKVGLGPIPEKINQPQSFAVRRLLLRFAVATPWPEVPEFYPGAYTLRRGPVFDELTEHAMDLGYAIAGWEGTEPVAWITFHAPRMGVALVSSSAHVVFVNGAVLYPGEPLPFPGAELGYSREWPPMIYPGEPDIPGVT